ncbi:tripartite motif-containing protein 2-like, partial [Littorina saxatilis]
MATGGNDAESAICAVCLDIYRDPKFLPCHHTFCAQCITDVANRHTGGTFPCPSCRKPTSLPQGGVAAPQANFYIKKQSENNEENSEEMCKLHKKRELELFCVRCQEAICINCKMTKHEQHQTDDLHTAIQHKHKELLTKKTLLQKAEKHLRESLKTTRAEQQALLDKKAAVEKNIRDRHAVMVAAADKFRDEALGSLCSVSTDIDIGIDQILKQQEGDLEKCFDIQRQVERACNSGRASDVITVVQEMKTGRGSEQAIKKLTPQGLETVYRPVLSFKVTGNVILQTTRDFVGTVTKMEMEVAAPEVRVVKRFPCGLEADIEVFSLCHDDEDPPVVRVSFERRQLKEDAPGELYSEDGQYKQNDDEVGKVSNKRYAKG